MSPNLELDNLLPGASTDHLNRTRLAHSEKTLIGRQGTMLWNCRWLSPAGGNVDSGASVGRALAQWALAVLQLAGVVVEGSEVPPDVSALAVAQSSTTM